MGNLLTTTKIWGLYQILSFQMTKTFRGNCDKIPEIKMDLNLNPADFQLSDGFRIYEFCITVFGFDNIALNFFTTFSSVSKL